MRRRSGNEHRVEVHISEARGIRSMHLNSETVQSAMRISDPNVLVLAYTQSMMAFLLLQEPPKKLWMIGLGGGSIPKFIYQYLPDVQQSVIELHASVVDLARYHFAVPADDGQRFRILEADGAAYVQDKFACVDTILIDGFDGFVVAPELGTEAFFANCCAALREGGVLAMNLWRRDKLFPVFCQRLARAFGGQVWLLPAQEKGNTIAFVCKSASLPKSSILRHRALLWQEKLGLPLTDFAKDLVSYTDDELQL